jgi:hypothetical protein
MNKDFFINTLELDKLADDSVLPWRIITLWQQIDGETLFNDHPSLLKSSEMIDPKPSSNLGKFVDYISSLGFNAVDLHDHPEKHNVAIAGFARYLKARGIKLLLGHAWPEFEHGGHSWVPILRTKDLKRKSLTLCPFNPKLRQYWQDIVEREFIAVPDLGGFKFGMSTESYFMNGAPWMCECEKCKPLTRQERFLVGLKFVADLLASRDAVLFWNNHQDDPWGQHTEIDIFSGLTGKLPENAQVMFSETYFDQEPGWPSSPLFDHLKKPDSGRAPYLVRVQLPGQYRGMGLFPCSMVHEWAKTFGEIRRLGLSGIWVQAFLNCEELDHPLNYVNWYALSRYSTDPDVTAEQIVTDWASETYGAEAAPTVVKILNLSYEASVNMFMCGGLLASTCSAMPNLTYLDSHLCGPERQVQRVEGHIGMDFPLDMYSPERATEIKANPKTKLLFGKELITPEIKAGAIGEKMRTIELLDKMIALWESVQDKVDSAVYQDLLARLKGNRVDAMVFRAMMDMYFDWKLGLLTESRIDEVLESFAGLKGIIVPDPAGPPPTIKRSIEEAVSTNLRSFAEDLRRELKEPWIKKFFEQNPFGTGVELHEFDAQLYE